VRVASREDLVQVGWGSMPRKGVTRKRAETKGQADALAMTRILAVRIAEFREARSAILGVKFTS
jgi:hypothetical protein